MKVLLLGANGQLGRTFFESGGLAARGELISASRGGLLSDGSRGEAIDLSAPASLCAALDRVQPDLIVNAAAYTAVDRAEEESELANRINGEAVGVIGGWAASHDAKVIHYSTDYVFDGSQSRPYAVDAPTAPLGAYGRSKLLGERALINSGADHLILRTAWVYAPHGHNFMRTMLRLGSEHNELRVVADQYGAPTDTNLIVQATLCALDRWYSPNGQAIAGIYHLVASGSTTWQGFAEAIFECACARGLIAYEPKVIPISSADYPTAARRPASSILDNRNFEKDFGFTLHSWQDGLLYVVNQIMNARR